MKLFLISQIETGGYDTFDSAIVAAGSADEARSVHPEGPNGWRKEAFRSWASAPSKVSVQEIGEAAPGVPAGVVLASFNAG